MRRFLTNPRTGWLPVVALALVGLAIWQQVRSHRPIQSFTLHGNTMGTTYAVTVAGWDALAPERLQAEIDRRLKEINASMSTYDKDSEISRINATPPGIPVALSADFLAVLSVALRLGEQTGGALDVTVGPLVNLWGYGPVARDTPPSPEEIQAAERTVGLDKLVLNGQTLTKRAPGMYLDFSAIAKGFGVDEVGRLLREHGVANFLVEIGGEVVAQGTSPRGDPWAVGIETPREGEPPGADIYSVARLGSGALATSGSYRRFRRVAGKESTHIIDPRTGQPVAVPLVSVTVFAADCIHADGIATALMVMGTEQGLRWVEGQPGVEALFLELRPDGTFAQRMSPGFRRLVE